MAISVTSRTYGTSTVDGTTAATSLGGDGDGTYTPAANVLLLASCGTGASAGTADPTSVTGHGVTWSKIGGLNLSASNGNISLWAALSGGSPTDTVITFNYGATQTSFTMATVSVTGAYVSGTTADAIAQVATNTGIVTDTTGSVTLAAAANSLNRPYAFFVQNAVSGNIVAGTNFTNLCPIGNQVGSPNRESRDIWRSDAFDTSPNVTLGTAAVWSAIAVEIRDASAPPGGASTEEFFPVVVGA